MIAYEVFKDTFYQLSIEIHCSKELKEHTVFSHRHNGTHVKSKVSLSLSDINQKFPFLLLIFDNTRNFPILNQRITVARHS